MLLEIPLGTKPPSLKMAILLDELLNLTSITEERRAGHWINVHNRHWRSVLGGRYASVIREAEQLGYVERNQRYSVNRFSKSIRLSEQYRQPETTIFETNIRSASRIRLQDVDSSGHRLVSCFPLAELPERVVAKGWNLFCVRSIQRRSWYAIRCQYGRLHSSFTGLPKDIRQRITIEGSETVELDIANCQPLIVGILAARQPTPPPYQHPIYHMAHKMVLESYLKACSDGCLYESILDDCRGQSLFDWLPVPFRHRHVVDRPLARKDVKHQFIIMLFANNSTTARLPIFKVVKRRWPGVAQFIVKSKAKCYQNLARECQRFESRIMIDTVAGELAKEIPLVTIHDSIICRQSDVDRVAEALRTGFAKNGVSDVTIKHGF